MKRLVFAAFAVLFFLNGVQAQSGSNLESQYSRKRTLDFFVSYSNDSSHIYIGQEENRKLVGLGAGYSLRLVHKRSYEFAYEAEVRPLTFIRDPVVTGVSSVNFFGGATTIVNPPLIGPFAGPTTSNCQSGTFVYNGITDNGVKYTQTIVQQCGERWTYAGGISPMGLRFSFLKRHRVQPFLVANAGFLVAGRDVPVNYSSNFNFTFEGGAGVEWYSSHRRSWTIDYRVHHLSNANTGYYNPGIDSGVFRTSYRFGR